MHKISTPYRIKKTDLKWDKEFPYGSRESGKLVTSELSEYVNQKGPTFSSLKDAVSFVVSSLDKDDIEKLSAACKRSEITVSESAFKSLKSVHEKKSLPKLYKGKKFPKNAKLFKLGGHAKELGHIHIDFVKEKKSWQLDYIWMCR